MRSGLQRAGERGRNKMREWEGNWIREWKRGQHATEYLIFCQYHPIKSPRRRPLQSWGPTVWHREGANIQTRYLMRHWAMDSKIELEIKENENGISGRATDYSKCNRPIRAVVLQELQISLQQKLFVDHHKSNLCFSTRLSSVSVSKSPDVSLTLTSEALASLPLFTAHSPSYMFSVLYFHCVRGISSYSWCRCT